MRLVETQKKINQQLAKEIKGRGGISFGDLEDFVVSQDFAYSFAFLKLFDQGEIVKQANAMRTQGRIKEAEAHTPAKLLM